MASFTLYEGKNLKSMDMMIKQDPYVTVSIGDHYKKKSAVIKDGGQNPYFKEQELLMWIDGANWQHDVVVAAWDEDVGSDDLIGQTTFSMLDHMNIEHPDFAKENMYELFSKDMTKSHGHLLMKTAFLPAGLLTLHCVEGKGLRSMDTVGRQDPYVKFSIDGQACQQIKKTKVDTDGGTDPHWDDVIKLHIVDHYNLEIEVYDHDLLSDDDLIGKTTVSLLPVFKKGLIDTWVTVKAKNDWGQVLHLHPCFL